MTTDMAYGLTINPALEPFRAEIDHAFGFLDTCYGLRRMGNAARRVHYGADAPEGSLHVPSALFPSGVRIREDGIAPARSSLLSVEQGHGVAPLLPPVGPAGKDAASADGRFGYDAPGMIFHQLSRLEERDHSEGDRHGRFPFDASLAVPAGSTSLWRTGRPMTWLERSLGWSDRAWRRATPSG
jgi:hypothetical protein